MASELEKIRARRRAIADEDAQLAIAERVLLSMAQGSFGAPLIASALNGAARPRRAHGGGLVDLAVSVLPDELDRMPKNEFRASVEAKRGEPMTDGAFSTLLSRLTTSGKIEREGDFVRRRTPVTDEGKGGDDVRSQYDL